MSENVVPARVVPTTVWPFAVVGGVAISLQPFTDEAASWSTWWAGVALAAVGLALAWCGLLGSQRRSLLEASGGVVGLCGIALLRDGAGGSASGYGVLVLLPVVWFAYHGTRWQLLVTWVAAACALVGPIVAFGLPRYPASSWRGTFVLVAVLGMVAFATQRHREALTARSDEALRTAAQLRGALESIDDPIARYEVVSDDCGTATDLVCAFVNAPAKAMISGVVEGESLARRLALRGQGHLLATWLRALDSDAPTSYEFTSERWSPGRTVRLVLTPVPGGLVAYWRDLTDDRHRDEQLRRSLDTLEAVANIAGHTTLILDPELRVRSVSGSLERLVGITNDRADGRLVTSAVDELDRATVEQTLHRVASSGNADTIELRAIDHRADRGRRWLEGRATRVSTLDSYELHVVLRDIDDVHTERERLGQQAAHDELTGLLNRSGLRRYLDQQRATERMTVLYLDLDRFKSVNDNHGHTAGDVVLVEVADRLRRSAQAHNAIARLGGDEFVVVCTEMDRADRLADSLLEAIERPIDVGVDHTVCISASIGIATADPGEGFGSLLDRADRAMYMGKRKRQPAT